MRVVKILLSLGVVLCLFLVEEDGISAPAIVTSDEAQAPIITNVKLKTKKILPGKNNKLRFLIYYSDSQKDLSGGTLQLKITEVYGDSTEKSFDLPGSKFAKTSGKGSFKVIVPVGKCQTVLLDFILTDSSGNSSKAYRLAKNVEGITPLYDDFDGSGGFQEYMNSDLAEKGKLSSPLWTGNGRIVKKAGRGNVLEMNHNGKGEGHPFLYLNSSRVMKLSDVKSVSYDVMIPSGNTSSNFGGGIRFHTSSKEKYWHMQFGFWSNENEINLSGYWNNHITDESGQTELIRVARNTWHNIRVDILNIKKNLVNLAFYVDGKKIFQGVINAGLSLEKDGVLDWGPERAFVVYNGDPGTHGFAYIDNVRAEYIHDTKPVPNTAPLYDNFDGQGCYQNQEGANMAKKGELGSGVWSGNADVVKAKGHDYVAQISMANGEVDGKTIALNNPSSISYKDFSSFSADVMIPSKAKCKGFAAHLSLEGGYKDSGEKKYWHVALNLGSNENNYQIGYSTWLFGDEESKYYSGPGIKPDTWYNLRIDTQRQKDGTTRLSYFLNDRLLHTYVADEGKPVLSTNDFDGFSRKLYIWKREKKKDAIACFDNVRTQYRQIVRVPQIAPLYDDFDGHGAQQNDGKHLASNLGFSPTLWWNSGFKVVNSSIENLPDAENHNNVGKVLMTSISANSSDSATLRYPENINFQEYLSWSADALIPEESTMKDFAFNLDFHTSIPEQPPGASWYSQLYMKYHGDGDELLDIRAQFANKNMDTRWNQSLKKVPKGKWYNLRMDIVILNDKTFRLDYYIDNVLEKSIVPDLDDCNLLLNGNKNRFGPKRNASFGVWKTKLEGVGIGYMDNVRAVYTKQ